MARPPLRPLHSDATLSKVTLERFRRMPTPALIDSLRPGTPGALKVRPDSTMLDEHHRVAVLRDRGVDVNALPREILHRQP